MQTEAVDILVPFHSHSSLLLVKRASPCTSPRQRTCSTRLQEGKGPWLGRAKNLMKGCCEISGWDSRCQTTLAHWYTEQEFRSRRKVNLSARPSVVPKTQPLLLITYPQVTVCLFLRPIAQLPSSSENKNMYFLPNPALG